MVVVLQWYYNERDGRPVFPELSAVLGPFRDEAAAKTWIATASTWGGWGKYEYQVEKLHSPSNTEEPDVD